MNSDYNGFQGIDAVSLGAGRDQSGRRRLSPALHPETSPSSCSNQTFHLFSDSLHKPLAAFGASEIKDLELRSRLSRRLDELRTPHSPQMD